MPVQAGAYTPPPDSDDIDYCGGEKIHWLYCILFSEDEEPSDKANDDTNESHSILDSTAACLSSAFQRASECPVACRDKVRRDYHNFINETAPEDNNLGEAKLTKRQCKVLQRLVSAGLHVQQFRNSKCDTTFVKVGATDSRLLEEASANHLFALPINIKSVNEIINNASIAKQLNHSRKAQKLNGTMQRKSKVDRTAAAVVPSTPRTIIQKHRPFGGLYNRFDHCHVSYDRMLNQSVFRKYKDGSILTTLQRFKLTRMVIQRHRSPTRETPTIGAGLSMSTLKAINGVEGVFPLHFESTTDNSMAVHAGGGIHFSDVGSDEDMSEQVVSTRSMMRDCSYHEAISFIQLCQRPGDDTANISKIQQIRDYMGEEVGYYFAFLDHFIVWLNFPALLGFIVLLHQIQQIYVASIANHDDAAAEGLSVTTDWFSLSKVTVNTTSGEVLVDIFTIVPELPAVSILTSMWALIMLKFWRRKQYDLALRWGTIGCKETEVKRPECRQLTGIDPIFPIPQKEDGSLQNEGPQSESEERYFRGRPKWNIQAFAVMALGGMIFGVVVIMVLLTSAGSLLTSVSSERDSDRPPPSYITIPVLFVDALFKMWMSAHYRSMAVWLNNLENHHTHTLHQGSLIVKVVAFELINKFGTLFFFAFVKPNVNLFGVKHYCITALYDADIPDEVAQEADECFGVVGYALLIALITASTVGNVIELFGPQITAIFQRRGAVGAVKQLVKYRAPSKRLITRKSSSRSGGGDTRSLNRNRVGGGDIEGEPRRSNSDRTSISSSNRHVADSNVHTGGGGGNGNSKRGGYDNDPDGLERGMSGIYNNSDEYNRNRNADDKVGMSVCTEKSESNVDVDSLQTPLSLFEFDADLPEFEGTLNEFVELAVWLGWVSMFMAAFPGTPYIAWLSMRFEWNVDLSKLCHRYRRPLPRNSENIGPWLAVFSLMTTLAIGTNAAFILFSTDLYMIDSLWPFVFSIVAMLIFQMGLDIVFNDMPLKVRIQLQRNLYLERGLQDYATGQNDSDSDNSNDNISNTYAESTNEAESILGDSIQSELSLGDGSKDVRYIGGQTGDNYVSMPIQKDYLTVYRMDPSLHLLLQKAHAFFSNRDLPYLTLEDLRAASKATKERSKIVSATLMCMPVWAVLGLVQRAWRACCQHKEEDEEEEVVGMIVNQSTFVEAFMCATKQKHAVELAFSVDEARCIAIAFDSAEDSICLVNVEAFNSAVVDGEYNNGAVGGAAGGEGGRGGEHGYEMQVLHRQQVMDQERVVADTTRLDDVLVTT